MFSLTPMVHKSRSSGPTDLPVGTQVSRIPACLVSSQECFSPNLKCFAAALPNIISAKAFTRLLFLKGVENPRDTGLKRIMLNVYGRTYTMQQARGLTLK
jgi:hypothetical protein